MITNKDKYYSRGAIHIHSFCSDGTGGVSQISFAAKRAGLDWIIITDHNNMDIEEGYFNGVCVIKGEEISPETENHYLALGIKETVSPDLTSEEYIEEVKNQGGFGFASHPDENKNRKNSNTPICWADKEIVPDGIEIWNWFSSWTDNYNEKNFLTNAYAYFFRENLVKTPNKETVKWWDKLNKNSTKIVPAIGGVDAHALKVKNGKFTFTLFSYKYMLGTITNVIHTKKPLSKDFVKAKKQVLEALKKGHNTICRKKHSLNFYIKNSSATVYTGEKITLDKETELNIENFKKYTVKIYMNGKIYFEGKDEQIKLALGKKGKYRVEIHKGKQALTYSNPIRVV